LSADRGFEADEHEVGVGMRANEADGSGNGHGRAVIATHAIDRELYGH
jgi:hypothetical protein